MCACAYEATDGSARRGDIRHRGEGRETPVGAGTGSGVIAISLALYLPEVRIDAVDISPQAVTVAMENARRLGGGADYLIQAISLHRFPRPRGTWDRLESLYPTAELATLSKEVRAEPVIALDGVPTV